jgi:hypothetical protein
MELLALLVIAALVLKFMSRSENKKSASSNSENKKSASSKSEPVTKEEKILQYNTGWIEERWITARKERDTGELKTVPSWFFDDVTDRQLQKIEEIGLKIKGGRLTKGEASDIIGLFEPAEEGDIEILRYFKIPLKNMNKSKAKYEVLQLFNDPLKKETWKKRPASPMQKEFYKFFGLKVPKALNYEEASKFITKYKMEILEQNESIIDEWNAYEEVYDMINHIDIREDYELKKISLSLYRSAIDQLKNEGYSLQNLSDEPEIVVDKIIEIKPDIQKT